MQWVMSLFRGRKNRYATGRRGAWVMSALALAIGATAFSLTKGRRRNVIQRLLQPLKKRIPG
ncbi:hypothetical protein M5X11_32370 [Paenibacillus alginolyticus]|uniref:hypothetical protein n=1 Tax=Paenibacillus alginolyticus TaxID=59839 RepID=UPI000FDBF5F9|nr:hypothetical protein [Paenibacillus alginolyticus]MCY9669565.1 hypothetical protein [Paenibacillus alginolyticus]